MFDNEGFNAITRLLDSQ